MKAKIVLITLVCVVLALTASLQATVVIETVPVGNPGNPGEWSGQNYGGYHGEDRICGTVDYTYNISKFEVTAGQYAEFLNAVADTDTYGLYNTNMWSDTYGWGGMVERSGSSGSHTYSVASDWANRPVNYVSWGDAARFANWLHNGQPTGAQDVTTTEGGAYHLDGAMTNMELLLVERALNAMWAIPTEEEWYKAAYYKAGGTCACYWNYPTQSDTAPTAELAPGTDLVNGSANYWTGSHVDPTYHTSEVGAYTAKPSDSAYGTFDQGGNVWEWNESILYLTYRGLRGGSFDKHDEFYFDLHAAYRFGGFPEYENGSGFGLRVVRVGGLNGDLNDDGFVGQADLDMVLFNWGDTCPLDDPRIDTNRDNLIGQYDLDSVLNGWGDGTPPVPAPEPATLGILGLCGLVLLRRKGKSR